MSLVKPFKALRYNSKITKKISDLVCPPYDVMNAKEIAGFKSKNKYNFCNLILTDKKNTYKDLGERFKKWCESQVLIQDEKEGFYLYEQSFKYNGKVNKRFGFLTLLKVNQEGTVHPHEYTFSEHKKDRYRILKELKANMSPIFTLSTTKVSSLARVYANYKKKKPSMKFKDFANIENKLWYINDTKEVSNIQKNLVNKNLFIADGHHRFETAYNFFKGSKVKYKDLNYVLAFVTDSSSGILLLPTHRIVKIKKTPQAIIGDLSKYFIVEKTTKKNLEKVLNKESMIFGIYLENKYYILRLKNRKFLSKMITKKEDKVYKELEVYILHNTIFPLLGIEGEAKYTHSISEAANIAGKGDCVFLLPAPSLKSVFGIAKVGKRLPQKSTYFYPKLLSGVVTRRFQK